MDWTDLVRTIVFTLVVPWVGTVLVGWARRTNKLTEAQRITHITAEIVAAVAANNPNLTAIQVAHQALQALEAQFPGVNREILSRVALAAAQKVRPS